MDTEIVLSPNEAEEYGEIWKTIVNHRRLADYLEQGLYRVLLEKYGIDLELEDWELDKNRGVLRRTK